MNIIALVGFEGSGKGTVGDILKNEFQFSTMAFADPLKDTLSAVFQWPRYLLEGDTIQSREWREMIDPWWAKKLNIPEFTPRYALRNIGTELFREHFHEDIWRFNMELRIEKAIEQNRNIVLTDARFLNEIDLVKSYGGKIIRIKRGNEPEWYDYALQANDPSGGISRAESIETLEEKYKVHVSEYFWIGYDFDVIIENDGTFDDLKNSVSYII